MARCKITKNYIVELSDSEMLDLLYALDYVVNHQEEVARYSGGIDIDQIEEMFKSLLVWSGEVIER